MTTYIELTAPDYWASYLINNDATGLDADEIEQADAWCKRENVKTVLSVNGEPYFTWNLGLHARETGKHGGTVHDYQCELMD